MFLKGGLWKTNPDLRMNFVDRVWDINAGLIVTAF